MNNQIPDLFHAKIIRVDQKHNLLLAWFGGQYINIYSLKTKRECDLITVEDPVRTGWTSFRAVKKKMKEIINK